MLVKVLVNYMDINNGPLMCGKGTSVALIKSAFIPSSINLQKS
jgi:hypothetical protein